MQAIDVAVEEIKFDEYTGEHEELKAALTKWGAGRTDFHV